MTNEEIWECLQKGTYKKPNAILQARPDAHVDNHKGLPTQFTEEELEGAVRSGKGHVGWFRGKKIDKKKFMSALSAIIADKEPICRAYPLSGLSQPTFTKRANELLTNGMLPWYLFDDGKPLYLDFEDERVNIALSELIGGL